MSLQNVLNDRERRITELITELEEAEKRVRKLEIENRDLAELTANLKATIEEYEH